MLESREATVTAVAAATGGPAWDFQWSRVLGDPHSFLSSAWLTKPDLIMQKSKNMLSINYARWFQFAFHSCFGVNCLVADCLLLTTDVAGFFKKKLSF